MKIHFLFILRFLFEVSLLAPVDGYSKGAPPNLACEKMIPLHNSAEPQTSQSPYSVQAKENGGDQTFSVTLSGSGSEFKGFFLQARDASNSSRILSGSFVPEAADLNQNLLHTINCGNGNANGVTHSSSTAKSNVKVTWTPSVAYSGNAILRATFVQSFDTFWINQDSDPVRITASGTTAAPASDVNRIYSGCGTTKGCFGSPSTCVASKNCEMVVAYTMTDDGVIYEILRNDVLGDSAYVALGFSDDDAMGGDSVVACVYNAPSIKIKLGWNPGGKSNELLPASASNGIISSQDVLYVDNRLYCRFKNSFTWTVKGKSFDLKNNNYHLLLAYGVASGDGSSLEYHDSKIASAAAFNFSAFQLSSTAAPATTGSDSPDPSNEKFKSSYDGCGKTKGCYGEPDASCIENKNCEAFVSYAAKPNDAGIVFELLGKSDGYVAVGLSADNKMGDDSVTACLNVNGLINVKQAWNTLQPKSSDVLSDPTVGLSEDSGSSTDGTIRCRFTRDTVSTVKGTEFDLNSTKYHLLLAIGPADGETLKYHVNGKRWASAGKLNLNVASVVQGSKEIKVKIHGTLMIIAWIGTASIGMLLARYFKQVWTGSMPTGVKVWFFFHRLLMVLTVLLTIAAFILIFIDIGGLSQVGDNPHPILGIVTTALAVLQPVMALFRCHPESSKRPIFNWLHWVVGNSAQIIGVVAIFYAVELAKTNLPRYFDWILVAFIVFHVLFHLILQIMAVVNDGKTKKVHDMPMSVYGSNVAANGTSNLSDEQRDVKGASGRKMMLILYIFFNMAFIATFVAIIWIS